MPLPTRPADEVIDTGGAATSIIVTENRNVISPGVITIIKGPPGDVDPAALDAALDEIVPPLVSTTVDTKIATTRHVHTQLTPSSEWIVNHNLGFQPSVEVFDVGGNEVFVQVLHVSTNQYRVYPSPAMAGFARSN